MEIELLRSAITAKKLACGACHSLAIFLNVYVVDGIAYCAACFYDTFVATGKIGFLDPVAADDGSVQLDGIEFQFSD